MSSEKSPRKRSIPFQDDEPDLSPQTVVHRDGKDPQEAEIPDEYKQSKTSRRLFPNFGRARSVPDSSLLTDVRSGSSSSIEMTHGVNGVCLEHFKIERQIGTGGMATVFYAEDTKLTRPVALKVLSPILSQDEITVHRFRNEAKACANLDQENIARVYYIGEDAGLHFIAFEFVKGKTIRDLIREQGQLDPLHAINYTLQIAFALLHMSKFQVIHRDIKPSNILVTESQKAKLVDLGLARRVLPEGSTDLTVAGTTLGTFDYLPPEQAKDPRKVDVRSDIYALGCTLYHMLAGQVPYPEGNNYQKVNNHQKQTPPCLRQLNPRVPPELETIVLRMMAKHPDQRYQSPESLIDDLTRLATEQGVPMRAESVIYTPPPEQNKRFLAANASLLLACSLLLFIVFLVDRYADDVQTQLGQSTVPPQRSLSQNANLPSTSPEGNSQTVSSADQNVLASHNQTSSGSHSTTDNSIDDRNNTLSQTSADPHAKQSSSHTGSTSLNLEASPQKTLAETGHSNSSKSRLSPLRPILNTPYHSDDDRLEQLFHILSLNSYEGETVTENSALKTLRQRNQEQTIPVNSARRSTEEPNAGTVNDQSHEIVLITGQHSQSFTTLEAACAAAEDGSVILLGYNGPRRSFDGKLVSEKPIRIDRRNITIRGAAGFRPLIDFRPDDTPGIATESRMITVENGSLKLINLDIQLDVPLDNSTNHWAMVSLENADRTLFERVSLTMRNPHRKSASLIELLPGRRNNKMERNEEMMVEKLRLKEEVEMESCLLRGECHLFLCKQTFPVRIALEQSLVAIEGSAFSIPGNMEKALPDHRVELRVDHVTALLGQNFMQFDSGTDPARSQIPVAMEIEHSIFSLRDNDQPLIHMTGFTNPADFENLLASWKGQNNLFDQVDTFWSIQSTTLPMNASIDRWNFQTWRDHWLAVANSVVIDPVVDVIAWKVDWRLKRFSEILARDAALPNAGTDVLFKASDGKDLGADLSLLPEPAKTELEQSKSEQDPKRPSDKIETEFNLEDF